MDSCGSDDLPPRLQLVYWASLAVFTVSSVVSFGLWVTAHCNARFFVRRVFCNDKGQLVKLTSLSAPFFTSLTLTTLIFVFNAILYIVFLMGQGLIFRPDLNTCLPWARYAVYSISCSLLAYEIGSVQSFVPAVKLAFIFLITATLLTGVFTVLSTTVTANRYIWYGIGFLTYIPALFTLFAFSDPWARHVQKRRWIYTVPIFVLLTWSIYPVAFILGPTLLNVVSLTVESWIYLGADLLTKVAFGFWVSHPARSYD